MSSSEGRKRYAAVWGNGDYGRLGFGSLESQWRPKLVDSSSFHNQNLKSISCGGAHTLFLTETGRVYATGLNDFGQLGISDNNTYCMEPLEVSRLKKEIVQISAGYHHSGAITEAKKAVPLPTKVECLSGINIKMVALASEHSVAITGLWRAGLKLGRRRIWATSTGVPYFKVMNLGGMNLFTIRSAIVSLSLRCEYTPRHIKKLEGVKVKNIAAGLLHSACIDENGSVYVFGERAVDKLGFGDANNATTPSMIRKLPYSQEVASGGYHTCVDKICFVDSSTDVLHLPERVEGPFLRSPVDKVSCGWKHTAVISDGNVFTWGWGGSHGTFSEDGLSSGGQLGHGDDIDYVNPTLVAFEKKMKALEVSCGFNHTGAILESIEA
ncbi:unnamed protein product [Dovyalis caffra]|uniref:Ultraviolet-B receptor UVR8 n=1 Tax=Dovyalis caffra TaxID=77055 RepID=A0AAV1SPF3_9ROSI|nr:unnamed protein product [Dovyalis caffra]